MVGTITGMSQRQFQSTPPARGATAGNCLSGSGNHISIHAPREGGDQWSWQHTTGHFDFNPRPPRGGRPPSQPPPDADCINFNPRPPRGGRPWSQSEYADGSCHFNPRPREGGDNTLLQLPVSNNHFNPRPREGGDRGGVVRVKIRKVISIHAPARGATVVHRTGYAIDGISIHAPREGGDRRFQRQNLYDAWISIHAPARGATVVHRTGYAIDGISIHAPREGGDAHYAACAVQFGEFQSTPPARGATRALPPASHFQKYFNPRPPRGGRRQLLLSPLC